MNLRKQNRTTPVGVCAGWERCRPATSWSQQICLRPAKEDSLRSRPQKHESPICGTWSQAQKKKKALLPLRLTSVERTSRSICATRSSDDRRASLMPRCRSCSCAIHARALSSLALGLEGLSCWLLRWGCAPGMPAVAPALHRARPRSALFALMLLHAVHP